MYCKYLFCPDVSHIFMIMDEHNYATILNRAHQKENILKTSEIEHIHQLIDHIMPTIYQQWSITIILECDFQAWLNMRKLENLGGTNPSSQNPVSKELLALSLAFPMSHSDFHPSNTAKLLDRIPDEDIIEICI